MRQNNGLLCFLYQRLRTIESRCEFEIQFPSTNIFITQDEWILYLQECIRTSTIFINIYRNPKSTHQLCNKYQAVHIGQKKNVGRKSYVDELCTDSQEERTYREREQFYI